MRHHTLIHLGGIGLYSIVVRRNDESVGDTRRGNYRKDVKTTHGLLRHAKVTTTLDRYSQSIDAAKLEAQEDIALAITSTAAAD